MEEKKEHPLTLQEFLASHVRDMSIAPRFYVLKRIETEASSFVQYMDTTDDSAQKY
jgi:hypothetical protein